MCTLKLDFRALIIGGAIALAIAGLAGYFFDIPFLLAIAGALVAMFVNSFVAELEDNAPGGFNNSRSEGEEDYSERKRRLLPYRIVVWVVFLALMGWLIYASHINGV